MELKNMDLFKLVETGHELGELFQVLHHSLEDGKITKEELDEILEKIYGLVPNIMNLVDKIKQ